MFDVDADSVGAGNGESALNVADGGFNQNGRSAPHISRSVGQVC